MYISTSSFLDCITLELAIGSTALARCKVTDNLILTIYSAWACLGGKRIHVATHIHAWGCVEWNHFETVEELVYNNHITTQEYMKQVPLINKEFSSSRTQCMHLYNW